MSGARERRFASRDRVWLGVTNVQLISTPTPLEPAAVRSRVADLAVAEPGLRFFTRTAPGRPDRYLDAATPAEAGRLAQNLVEELPGSDLQSIADSAAAVLDRDRGLPIPAVFAAHGMIGQRFPHVFGDGLSAITHLRRLAIGPEIDSRVAPWPIPGLDHPLSTVLRERYLRAPRALRDAVRMERPTPVWTGPRLESAPGEKHAVQILCQHLDGSVMGEIKAWRKARQPGISTMSIVVAALRRGLAREHIVPADSGIYMAFDLRSYLPKGAGAAGNFISAPYLAPGDPLSAASIHESVQQAAASGRPVLGLAAAAARLAVQRRTPLPAMRRPSNGRDVAISHMRVGKVLPLDMLAEPGGTAAVLAAATPSSVGSISYTLVEVADQMTVTAVFCSPFTPRDQMASVLDDLARSPVDLLA